MSLENRALWASWASFHGVACIVLLAALPNLFVIRKHECALTIDKFGVSSMSRHGLTKSWDHTAKLTVNIAGLFWRYWKGSRFALRRILHFRVCRTCNA